ncbi:MAG: N,N-dimethylformamidase beta subunit family domain-containing protein [Acidimicrobiales bacterium]
MAAATAFGPGGVTAAWVQQENAKPGTRDWAITQPAAGAQIAGYASRVSVDVGDSVDLYVSTPAPSYRVDAYRMGWYGGDQARLVWSSPTVAGTVQPYCGVDPSLRMVSCNWNDPFTVATAAASWPQGDYLFKLTSSAGFQSYVPLTVRDDASRSAYLVNNDVTSWQAYNLWGDYDFYQGPTPSGGASLALRSYALSFDRPYLFSDGDGQGSSDFIGLELPMVTMMESLGLDVSYTTDIDFSENPAILEQHRSFITLGHDEYYSLAMRNGVIAARDQGVNLVFLGANAIYRHIRLQSSALGPDRVEVDYKDPSLDPLYGTDNADVTPWAWRDPPNNLPESVILGGMWQCNPVDADMVITSAGNWMFAGTGLVDGSLIPGIVGPEFDHYSPSQPSPLDVTVVAASPVTCDGQAEEADMTYYTAPSGAGVWDTGTIDWVGSLHPGCPGCPDPGVVTAITANVLAAFGRGPAGRVVPVTAN